MAIIKNQLNIGTDTLYLETSADVVKYGNNTVEQALNNAVNPTVPGASSFGQKILACKSAEEMAALLHLNGAPLKFFDECENRWTVTGSPKLVTTNKRFGQTCLYCPANSRLSRTFQRLRSNITKYTFDFWLKTNVTSGFTSTAFLIGDGTTSVSLKPHKGLSYQMSFWVNTTQDNTVIAPANTRCFFRITYNNGTWSAYVDGVLKKTQSASFKWDRVYLGYDVACYFDEFRILEDVALTTGVPTAPFSIDDYPDETISLLHFES